MSTISILQLSTYPIKDPMHGGQRRSRAIRDAYVASGVNVKYVSLLYPVPYKPEQADESDIFIGKEITDEISRTPMLEDIIMGERFHEDREGWSKLLAQVEALKPSVIQLEQPYLWPIAKKLVSLGLCPGAKIVYSSHNHESEMKAVIYERVLPKHEAAVASLKVREIEMDLVRSADVITTVSQLDADAFRKWGGRNLSVIRNGGEPRTFDLAVVQSFKRDFESTGKTRRALFVGSAHLPNLTGLIEMMGSRLGFLPPDSELILAGGIFHLLGASELFEVYPGANSARLRLYPSPTDAELAALFELADVVLLPITSGGGSNLKTVEALFSMKPVVATSFAFRSYEEFSKLSRVRIEDDPARFQQAVLEALAQSSPATYAQTERERELLETISWRYLGDQFVKSVLKCL